MPVRRSSCTNVKKLTSIGWKEHFEVELTERGHVILPEILRAA